MAGQDQRDPRLLSAKITAWQPEPLFAGQTVFLLGGGPSLTPDDVARLRDRPTIAVNMAAALAPWADVLFFRDLDWFLRNRPLVGGWAGLAVTINRSAAIQGSAPGAPSVKRVATVHCADFPAAGSAAIRYGRSSGHLAVSLAIAMGARRVALLGYDCRFVDGRSHFHDQYSAPIEHVYTIDFLPAWRGWGVA